MGPRGPRWTLSGGGKESGRSAGVGGGGTRRLTLQPEWFLGLQRGNRESEWHPGDQEDTRVLLERSGEAEGLLRPPQPRERAALQQRQPRLEAGVAERIQEREEKQSSRAGGAPWPLGTGQEPAGKPLVLPGSGSGSAFQIKASAHICTHSMSLTRQNFKFDISAFKREGKCSSLCIDLQIGLRSEDPLHLESSSQLHCVRLWT